MIYGIAARPLAGAESPTGARSLITARRAAVISIGGFDVYDVADASILWAFCCVVDTLSEQCRRRRPGANPLVVAIFRINRRAAERSSATCQRRRSPCPLGFPGDGLEITAVLGTRGFRTD